jgi:hypothetical protein
MAPGRVWGHRLPLTRTIVTVTPSGTPTVMALGVRAVGGFSVTLAPPRRKFIR